jgi:hypothetical protein
VIGERNRSKPPSFNQFLFIFNGLCHGKATFCGQKTTGEYSLVDHIARVAAKAAQFVRVVLLGAQ